MLFECVWLTSVLDVAVLEIQMLHSVLHLEVNDIVLHLIICCFLSVSSFSLLSSQVHAVLFHWGFVIVSSERVCVFLGDQRKNSSSSTNIHFEL